MSSRLKRSQLFESLPADLSQYEHWLPGFPLIDGPGNSVHVVFRPNSNATAADLRDVQDQETTLAREWWMSILIPALSLLPDDTKTHLFNVPNTSQITGILPMYIRIYPNDLRLLDVALQATTRESNFEYLSWYFVCSKYGQRFDLEEGEVLGPAAFHLSEMYDFQSAAKVSIHLAMNFRCKDSTYSLFWEREKTYTWSSPGSECQVEE